MRLNFRLGKPGAVLSSFLGVLDIKLGQWCAARGLWRRG